VAAKERGSGAEGLQRKAAAKEGLQKGKRLLSRRASKQKGF
jgi:hypothetical protein